MKVSECLKDPHLTTTTGVSRDDSSRPGRDSDSKTLTGEPLNIRLFRVRLGTSLQDLTSVQPSLRYTIGTCSGRLYGHNFLSVFGNSQIKVVGMVQTKSM